MNSGEANLGEPPGGEAAKARWEWTALAAVMAMAVGLRWCRLNDRGLWFDEAFSWRMSTFGWTDVIYRSALDNNPPLYYLLLKLWTSGFGTSAGALRSLSVLAGAGTCLAMYGLVREAYGGGSRGLPRERLRLTALATAALVAASVLQIRWSCEARMYSLGALGAAESSWLLVRALHTSGASPGRWLAYAATALAFAYTHTFALFSLLAQGLFAVGYLSVAGCNTTTGQGTPRGGAKSRWVGPLLAAAVVAAGYAPWLNVLAAQHEQVRRSFWIGPLTRDSMPHAAHTLFVNPMEGAPGAAEGWICAGVSALVLAALAFRPLSGDWLLLLSAAVPFIGAAVASACGTSIFYPRYFVFAQLFLLAAAARLVGRVPGLPERWIVALSLVASFLLIDLDDAERTRIGSGGLRSAASFLAGERTAGEPVVVCSPYLYLPLRYELNDAECRLLIPERPMPHYDGAAALTPDDVVACTDLADCHAQRLWLIEGGAHAVRCQLPWERWRQRRARSFFESYGIPGSIMVVEYERTAD